MEAIVKPGHKSLYPKGRGARCRKLDCQRGAVEATTNSGDRGQNACVWRKMRRGRACPIDEKPNRAVAKRVLAIRAIFRGHREWLHRIDLLPLRAQRLAAGSDHPRRPGWRRQPL